MENIERKGYGGCAHILSVETNGMDKDQCSSCHNRPESVIDKVQPHAFAAMQHTKNPDLPTYAEAMSGDHAEEYWEAMRKEIANLVKRNVWEVIPRSSIPEGVKTVPGTWSFRCKELSSLRCRLCGR